MKKCFMRSFSFTQYTSKSKKRVMIKSGTILAYDLKDAKKKLKKAFIKLDKTPTVPKNPKFKVYLCEY